LRRKRDRHHDGQAGIPATFMFTVSVSEVCLAPAREPGTNGNKNLITVWLLVIIVLMLIYAVFGERGVIRTLKAERQKEQLQEQLAVLQQQQQQLKEEIERLQNDKDYWEQLAREKLGMVREGELIYHLPPKEE
jgi:cell division protein FtsB